MSEVVVSLFGTGTRAPGVVDERIVDVLRRCLVKAEAGEAFGLALVLLTHDGPYTVPEGCLAPSCGDARLILGAIEEVKFDILKALAQA